MAQRIYTGLAGLPVVQNPHLELAKLYSKILRHLKTLPENSKYRIITHQLINERKTVVESTTNRDEIEKKIGGGLCEELIEQAKGELKLIEVMEKHRVWEPLVEKPPANQWKWPL